MRILFQSRGDLFSKRGGDTVQMEKLASELGKLGVHVDIDNSLSPNLGNYDIVNVFNINHIVEFYPQITNAKKQGKKVVLSPIYHSVREIERWEKQNAYGARKLLNILGVRNQYMRDHIKNLYRIFVEGMYFKLKPFLQQIIMGTINQQQKALELSDMVFVQTEKEVQDIKDEVGVSDFKYQLVVNGVDKNHSIPNPSKFIDKYGYKDFLLEVGRIEPRKNQLKVIYAYQKLKKEKKIPGDTKLIFIGDKNSHHSTYYKTFRAEIAKDSNIIHLGYLDYDMVQSSMAVAQVLVYPTWFETTGLVAIEALLAGTKVVVSGERVREYVGGNGEYADPASVEDIADAIIRSINKDYNVDEIRAYLLHNFTWEIAALMSLKGYQKILND